MNFDFTAILKVQIFEIFKHRRHGYLLSSNEEVLENAANFVDYIYALDAVIRHFDSHEENWMDEIKIIKESDM